MPLGDIINQFFEEIAYTNYGNDFFVLYGRDIGYFIVGYLTHLIITAFIFTIRGHKDKSRSKGEKE